MYHLFMQNGYVINEVVSLKMASSHVFQTLQQQQEEAKSFENQMHERFRKICQEKERVKRELIERDNEIVRLQEQLVERTQECMLIIFISASESHSR